MPSIHEIADRERQLEGQIDQAVRSGIEDTGSTPQERVETVAAELRGLGVEPNVDNLRRMFGDEAEQSDG